uniref:Cell wall hydroxyproline-rich glycoprotein n=1 Tax=Triticum urartu TaxID=4572 RepID=A0A8R7UP73_TRIUA
MPLPSHLITTLPSPHLISPSVIPTSLTSFLPRSPPPCSCLHPATFSILPRSQLNAAMIRRGMPPPLALLLLLALLGAFAAAQQEGNVPEQYAASLATRFDAPAGWPFPNPRLRAAYAALQAWKQTAIFSDPANFTANWQGPDVCRYNGVYCAPAPSAAYHGAPLTVAGIDLNHADIAGYIPASLPLGLPDLALLHLNSNRFCGVVPDTFRRLRLLHELDLSNNRFVGAFPEVVLALPSLRYLDLRFNDFEGSIPPALFDRPLDAIFLNSNRLRNPIPANLGNSPASVVVLAHNRLGGCIPPSIGRMADTLNEIVLIDDMLTGCVPPQVGLLKKVTVFDVSGRRLRPRRAQELHLHRQLHHLAPRLRAGHRRRRVELHPRRARAAAGGAVRRRGLPPVRLQQGAMPVPGVHSCHSHHARWWQAFQPVLPVAAVKHDHSVVPLASQGLRHAGIPLAASGIHHPVLPVATVELQHPVIPLATPGIHHAIATRLDHAVVPDAAVQLQHPVVPLAAPGIHHAIATRLDHAVVPDASVELQHPVVPLAAPGIHHPITTAGLNHSIVPDAAVQLQHPVIPLAAAEHAGDPVVPVSFVRHPDASRRPRAASPNLGRQARRAVRAASGLVRPHDALRLDATILRQPPDAVAAHG